MLPLKNSLGIPIVLFTLDKGRVKLFELCYATRTPPLVPIPAQTSQNHQHTSMSGTELPGGDQRDSIMWAVSLDWWHDALPFP